MPQNARLILQPNVAKLLTDSNVTEVSFSLMNDAMSPMRIMGSVGAVEPTIWGPEFLAREGFQKLVLADLFLGMTGVNRLWALCGSAATVWVIHA